MKRYLLITTKIAVVACVAFLTMGASCITTGNIMVVVYLEDMHAETGATITAGDVNLADEPDWYDHIDDIAAIDDIGFACRIKNNSNVPATGQLYVSPNDKIYTTETAIRTNGLRVLDGIIVPAGGTRDIEWQDSYDYLENFDEAKAIIYGKLESKGMFHYYFIAAETPFNIDVTDVVLFMSVNGKP